MTDKNPLDVQVGGDHYKSMPIQPVEFNYVNSIPYIEGTIIKYVSRWRSKGGIQDLEKAKHFIDLLIELEAKYKKEEKPLKKAITIGSLPDKTEVLPVAMNMAHIDAI